MAAMSNAELAAVVAGRTVPGLFAACVAERPDAVALRWKEGDGWAEWTWSEYADRACRMAAGLAGLGVGRGDRVVLMMRNRPEFHVADIGALLVGATPISIYNSSAPEQVQYLAGHCRARLAIVEDHDYLERVLEVRDELPGLEEVVADRRRPHPTASAAWPTLLGSDPVDLATAAAIAQPDDLATVIYTSGTTGPPKGVMLDHANVCWTVESLRRAFGDHDPTGSRLVSYLPMAHIAERMMTHYQGIAFGYEVTTCPEAGAVAQYLPAVRPQLFFAVPRVWEKMYAGLQACSPRTPTAKRSSSALDAGAEAAACRARDEPLPADLVARYEPAETSMLRPVRALLGLDQVESAISGAAPLPVEILRFFRALGRRALRDLRALGVVRPDDLGAVPVVPGRSARRSPAARSSSLTTARCSAAAATCSAATSTIPRRPPRRSTPTAGSTPATSASSTTTATCASSTARRSSSSPRAARTSRRRTSRPR